MQTDNNSLLGQECVVIHNVVPVHSKPDSSSEQVSQAILGQTVVIEAGQKDWYFVKMWDSYRGWIKKDFIRPYISKENQYCSKGIVAFVKDLIADVYTGPREKAQIITKAVISTELSVIRSNSEWAEILLPNNDRGFIKSKNIKLYEKNISNTVLLPTPEKISEVAFKFIGVPYLWGGCTPFGLDCSGFVQLVYKILGIIIPRDAYLQADDPRCHEIALSNVNTGDFLFFCSKSNHKNNKITHVGLAINNKTFIHSSSSKGVYLENLDKYESAKLVFAKRISFGTLDLGFCIYV